MFRLDGQVALVTGATGGIGAAIVDVLHKMGAKVVASGTKRENLEKLASKYNSNILIKECNLSDLAQTEELVDFVVKECGKIDILVCNAGITKDNLSIRMKNEDFTNVIDVNLTSTFVLNRTAIKYMMKNKYGRIINIASIVGVMGNAGQANYTASKAGMIGMSKSLASETASRSITVNCIAPGFIETPMTDVLNEDQKGKMLSRIPSGKFGKPDDIAYSVAFLASKESGYISGQTMHINGGMLMV